MMRADYFAPELKSDKQSGFGYVGWDIVVSEEFARAEANRLSVILKEKVEYKVTQV